MLFRSWLVIGFVLGLLLFFAPVVTAQDITSEGVAVDVIIEDKNASGGAIISLSNGKYRLSELPYDPSIFGVITDNPAVVFEDIDSSAKKSVVAFGKAKVQVATINGVIKAGDLITTSTIKGVGQKATENGYVIGIALEDYEDKNPQKVGTIFVSLHLNFGMLSSTVRENLISSLKRGAIAPFSSPMNAFRYIMAAVIAIVSFATGFWFFGRISSHGVDAIGRNPLARRFILLSVALNVVLTVSVMLFGVALAYLILVL